MEPRLRIRQVDPEVLEITSRAARVFEDLGCEVEQADIALDPPYDTFGPIIAGDFYTNFGRYKNNGDELFTDYAKFLLERGSRVTVADYARALGEMDLLKARMTDLFERFDLLLTPTACFPAFKYGEFPGEVTWHFRIPRSVLERGLHIADKRHWSSSGECPGGIHVRWSARRVTRGRQGTRRTNGVGRVGGVRVGATVGPCPAARFMTPATAKFTVPAAGSPRFS